MNSVVGGGSAPFFLKSLLPLQLSMPVGTGSLFLRSSFGTSPSHLRHCRCRGRTERFPGGSAARSVCEICCKDRNGNFFDTSGAEPVSQTSFPCRVHVNSHAGRELPKIPDQIHRTGVVIVLSSVRRRANYGRSGFFIQGKPRRQSATKKYQAQSDLLVSPPLDTAIWVTPSRPRTEPKKFSAQICQAKFVIRRGRRP